MVYIKSRPENDNYGSPHFPPQRGDIELPQSLIADYLDTKGFAILTIENGEITAIERNDEAYNAYIADHPDITPVSELERLEAQVLYTALMTDTLIEE